MIHAEYVKTRMQQSAPLMMPQQQQVIYQPMQQQQPIYGMPQQQQPIQVPYGAYMQPATIGPPMGYASQQSLYGPRRI